MIMLRRYGALSFLITLLIIDIFSAILTGALKVGGFEITLPLFMFGKNLLFLFILLFLSLKGVLRETWQRGLVLALGYSGLVGYLIYSGYKAANGPWTWEAIGPTIFLWVFPFVSDWMRQAPPS